MPPMSEAEIHALKQGSNWTLKQRMDEVQKEFQLDAYPEFAWHPWRGELVFSVRGVPKVVARIQVAGTLSRGGSWTWAWARTALPGSVREAARRAREFGEERTVLALAQPSWSAKEQDAWHMTAIACSLIDGKGAFKVPGPDASTFLVITELRTVSDRARVFGARTCAHVLEEDRPILLVSREKDGEVLAVCGGEDDTAETMRGLTLDQLLSLDPSLNALAEMPDGWAAVRDSVEHEWAPAPSE